MSQNLGNAVPSFEVAAAKIEPRGGLVRHCYKDYVAPPRTAHVKNFRETVDGKQRNTGSVVRSPNPNPNTQNRNV